MTIRPSPHLLHHPSTIEALIGNLYLDIAECIHVVDTIFFLGLGLIWWLRAFVPRY